MSEPGFELKFPEETEATFVPFSIGMSVSKDLKIIDRCTAMPLDEFAEAFEDPPQRGRGSVMLAMMGVSIRAQYPDWSVDRIMRIIDDLDLSDIEFLKGKEESNGDTPLPVEPTASEDSATSGSPSDESSSSATPTPPAPSETSSETPD